MRARFFEVRKDPFLLGVRTNIELERREVAHVEPDELERATHLALVDAGARAGGGETDCEQGGGGELRDCVTACMLCVFVVLCYAILEYVLRCGVMLGDVLRSYFVLCNGMAIM